MQPEECKAISKAVGSVYEPEQVRLLLHLHNHLTVLLYVVMNRSVCSGDAVGSLAESVICLPSQSCWSVCCCKSHCCVTCYYFLCKVAKKFVYGIERGRYLLPSADTLQDWFLADATASWSTRTLPLLVSCILGPIIPLAMFVYTKLVDRIVRQHRHKREAQA